MLNLEKFKVKLHDRKSIILKRLEGLEIDIQRKNGALDADWQEQAQAIQNDEVIDRLDEIERHELHKIDLALDRINQGAFGKCVDCGGSISEKRLEAMPFAMICSDCAQ